MKTEILNAILADAGFRAESLRQVKCLARRRRLASRGCQVAIVCALAMAALWIALVRNPQITTPERVVSHTFGEVRTRSGLFTEVRSGSAVSMAVAEADIRIFGTWDLNPNVRLLDDRELVATLRKHRAMLIYPNSQDARVIVY